ncbi:MAG: hypothetical protein E6H09_06365 [Bacteroidetes bacterium]|jgi:hypothetical protein|nr:MAG: hypothetical protein E6H09_06365 [Bacteroidota bacterium]
MKKYLVYGILLSLALFVFATVGAQKKNEMTTEEMAGKLTGWMKTNLELTDNQVGQVQTINLKYANKMMELQNDGSSNKKQKMRAMKADSDAKDQELKRVLTADQFQSWLVKKDEAKKALKEKIKEKQSSSY